MVRGHFCLSASPLSAQAPRGALPSARLPFCLDAAVCVVHPQGDFYGSGGNKALAMYREIGYTILGQSPARLTGSPQVN